MADVITFSEIAWEEVDEKIIGNCFNKILGNYEYTESNFIREDTANFEKIIIESKIHDPVNLEAYFKTEYTEGDAILDEIEESMSQKNDFEIEKKPLEEVKTPDNNEEKNNEKFNEIDVLKSFDTIINYYKTIELGEEDYEFYKMLVKQKLKNTNRNKKNTLIDYKWVKKEQNTN